MSEIWKPIPGHRGYEASDAGRVRSIPRTLRDGRQAGGLILQPTPDKDGYLRVGLRGKRLGVHQAVALAFHGPPEVRHLNGDHTDNSPANIRWGSHRENEQDKRRNRRKKELGQVGVPPSGFGTFPETRLISLSEAVLQGYVSCTLHAVRKASQRDPAFPVPAAMDGMANLYDSARLTEWDERYY